MTDDPRLPEMRRMYVDELRSFQEIGDAYGLTRERIRQIFKKDGVEIRKTGAYSRRCRLCKKVGIFQEDGFCGSCQEDVILILDPKVHPADAAKALGKREAVVRSLRRNKGVPFLYDKKNSVIPRDFPEDFLDHGKSHRSLAKKYGLHEHTVGLFRNRKGIKFHEVKNWTEEETAKLEDLRKKGATVKRCAKILGRTIPSVESRLAKIKKRRRHDGRRA